VAADAADPLSGGLGDVAELAGEVDRRTEAVSGVGDGVPVSKAGGHRQSRPGCVCVHSVRGVGRAVGESTMYMTASPTSLIAREPDSVMASKACDWNVAMRSVRWASLIPIGPRIQPQLISRQNRGD
jgi:hypothetical protein